MTLDNLYFVDYFGQRDDEIVPPDRMRPRLNYAKPLNQNEFLIKRVNVSKALIDEDRWQQVIDYYGLISINLP
jgi:hypothetical protein